MSVDVLTTTELSDEDCLVVVTLDDPSGQIELPRPGAAITASLGWSDQLDAQRPLIVASFQQVRT